MSYFSVAHHAAYQGKLHLLLELIDVDVMNVECRYITGLGYFVFVNIHALLLFTYGQIKI